jgi:hypothetical protein
MKNRQVQEFIDNYEAASGSFIDLEQANFIIDDIKITLSRIDDLSDSVLRKKAAFKSMCPHNLEPFVIEQHYISGDYLNVAETYHSVTCRTCGATLFEYVEQHNGRYS